MDKVLVDAREGFKIYDDGSERWLIEMDGIAIDTVANTYEDLGDWFVAYQTDVDLMDMSTWDNTAELLAQEEADFAGMMEAMSEKHGSVSEVVYQELLDRADNQGYVSWGKLTIEKTAFGYSVYSDLPDIPGCPMPSIDMSRAQAIVFLLSDDMER